MIIIVKKCSKCQEHKTLDNFYNDKMNVFGKSSSCKICSDKIKKQYYIKNKAKIKKYQQEYHQINKIDIRNKARKQANKYKKDKRKTDVHYKLRENLRHRIWNSLKLKSGSKNQKTMDLIGCSPQQLKSYLEKKFTDGMTWENYGFYGWHIDHIIPCNSFDLTDPAQQKICFHYTNLQPLWAKDNLEKGDKLILSIPNIHNS